MLFLFVEAVGASYLLSVLDSILILRSPARTDRARRRPMRGNEAVDHPPNGGDARQVKEGEQCPEPGDVPAQTAVRVEPIEDCSVGEADVHLACKICLRCVDRKSTRLNSSHT